MAIELTKQEREAATTSLQKYFRTEMDDDLGDIRARLLLDFFLKEIGPLAYNHGVKDAETFFRSKVEDLGATCFEEAMTYWSKKKK